MTMEAALGGMNTTAAAKIKGSASVHDTLKVNDPLKLQHFWK